MRTYRQAPSSRSVGFRAEIGSRRSPGAAAPRAAQPRAQAVLGAGRRRVSWIASRSSSDTRTAVVVVTEKEKREESPGRCGMAEVVRICPSPSSAALSTAPDHLRPARRAPERGRAGDHTDPHGILRTLRAPGAGSAGRRRGADGGRGLFLSRTARFSRRPPRSGPPSPAARRPRCGGWTR